MKKAEAADKALIIEILSRSFENNQSVNYIVKQDSSRINAIRALMDYSFEMCSLFGDVWLSDNHQACALVLYPQNKRATFKAILLDVKLIIKAIGLLGIKKTLNRESKIKAKQPKEPMAYLWFIGVEPNQQHKGLGSKLLQEITNDATAKQLPVYLETSTIKNLPWYERFGFIVYSRLELSYNLFFLKREADI
ncbi:GNAT family N-acetyltransferase [Mucilaginibacter gossypii]|uniref:Acetyltransferase (GNAT) family protein n=1 Tax=Mucilaginibacter gossypii TaxID=551996 RepID=A0A1G8D5G5_9SPHI|nr:GNAT family N-acetyltransferase [Mucilaginibacter gossypii]SDH53007.1 Acetyltransferase (GNAT) family protein [Mucilaginibacter gossypii]